MHFDDLRKGWPDLAGPDPAPGRRLSATPLRAPWQGTSDQHGAQRPIALRTGSGHGMSTLGGRSRLPKTVLGLIIW